MNAPSEHAVARIGWPRAILTAAVIVVVGIVICVYVPNAVLTKIHSLNRGNRVAIATTVFFVGAARAGVGAAMAATSQAHLMPAVPPVPDASWLWANEPCRAACPVHTDAGAYVTAIAEGRYEDAYLIARAPNPFPSVCGRVCAAPCERACRRGSVDAPVSIRALKRFVTERFGVESFAASAVWHRAHGEVPPADGPSVGVIGGGPAGLAAACDLRLAGHPVTVYEAQERLGGMMVLGIPEYRLPRALIAREIEAIIELGIDVETGARIGDIDHSRRAARRATPRCSSRSAPAAPAISIFPATSSTASSARSSTC